MTNKRTYPKSVQNCVRRCRRVARTALVVVTLFWMIFGIVTGSQAEGGYASYFKNLQNILPWLGIIILWFISWRWEILGGFMIIAFSIFMAFYMNVFESSSNEGIMIITPLAMTGFMFVFIGFRIWAARQSESAKQA